MDLSQSRRLGSPFPVLLRRRGLLYQRAADEVQQSNTGLLRLLCSLEQRRFADVFTTNQKRADDEALGDQALLRMFKMLRQQSAIFVCKKR